MTGWHRFPPSAPLTGSLTASEFIARIKAVGWAPCTAEQLLAYADDRLAATAAKTTRSSKVAVRRAKANAVAEWFAASGLPDALVTPADFEDDATAARWVQGVGLVDGADADEDFGIIAIGALDERPDGSAVASLVYRSGVVQRWDSSTGAILLERLLTGVPPLEIVSAVFLPDGSLVAGGFGADLIWVDGRTFEDAHQRPVRIAPEDCPHDGLHPDDAVARVTEIRGVVNGVLVRDCCGRAMLVGRNGRLLRGPDAADSRMLAPLPDAVSESRLFIVQDEDQDAFICDLAGFDIIAAIADTGGPVAEAVLVESSDIVTRSAGGVLEWWSVAASKPSAMVVGHHTVNARATAIVLLEAWGDRGPLLLASTKAGELVVFDAVSGKEIGRLTFPKKVERAVRVCEDLAVLWTDDARMCGMNLDELRICWHRYEQLTESAPCVVLSGARLLRAGFGVVVEDARTGEVLHAFDAPEAEDAEDADGDDEDPDEDIAHPSGAQPTKSPPMFRPEDFASPRLEPQDPRRDTLGGLECVAQSTYGAAGPLLYLLLRRPEQPLTREAVVEFARWIYQHRGVFVDRIGASLYPSNDGEQYEWFLRVDEIDAAYLYDTSVAASVLVERGLASCEM